MAKRVFASALLAMALISLIILWTRPLQRSSSDLPSPSVANLPPTTPVNIPQAHEASVPPAPSLLTGAPQTAPVETATIAGRVVSNENSGAPVSGVVVRAESKHKESEMYAAETGTSDNSGRFQIAGLAIGEYTVTVAPQAVEGVGKPNEWVATEAPKRVACSAAEIYDVGVILVSKGGSIVGRVTDEHDHSPLANAQVFAFPSEGGEGCNATSDSAGVYRITGLRAGSFEVSVQSAPRHLAQGNAPRRTVTVELGRESSNVDFALGVGVSLRGRVLDAQGAAAPKAEVFLFSANGNGSDKKTVADDKGRFTLENLAPGQAVGLMARAANTISDLVMTTTATDASGAETVLMLAAESAIAGHVLDDSGRPVAQAGVCIERDQSTLSPVMAFGTRTDAQGAYRFDRLPSGDFLVWAAPPSEVTRWAPANPNPDATVTEILSRISSAERAMLPKNFESEIAAKIRESANFLPDNYNPYHTLPDAKNKSPKQQVELSRGQKLERIDLVVATMPRLGAASDGAIAGHVLDSQGKPIESATVLLMAEEADKRSWAQKDSVQTDASGAFRFIVRDSENYMVEARCGAPGASVDASSETVTSGTEDIQLTLPRVMSLAGQVLDAEDHRPITAFEIGFKPGLQIRPGDWSTQWQTSPTSWAMGSEPPENSVDVRDPDGRFRLANVPESQVTVFVRAARHFIGVAQLKEPSNADITIALQRSASVRGVVTGPNNRPLPGAKIGLGILPENDPGAGFVTSGAKGEFTLESVFPVDEYLVWALHPVYAPASAKIKRGATSIAINLTVPCILQGTVRLNDVGKQGVFVMASSGAGGDALRRSAETGKDGRFSIQGLRQGTYTVSVSYLEESAETKTNALYSCNATVSVSPEAPANIDLALQRSDITFTGR